MSAKISPPRSDTIDFIDDKDTPFWPKKKLHMLSNFGFRMLEFDLSNTERIFLTLENPYSSTIANITSLILLCCILLATLVNIMATDPSVRKQPETCDTPVCRNDPILCPGSEICEPVPPGHLFWMELGCVVIFTIDYVVRISLVPYVNPRLSCVGYFDEFDKAHQTAEGPVVDPEIPPFTRWRRYATRFSSLVDLAAIVPFYVTLAVGGESTSFLRVLQLGRILRASKNNEGIEILSRTLKASQRELTMLLFYILLGVVVSGSLVYTFEKGTFDVSLTYPDGVYLRPTVDMQGQAPTPFVSVWASIYWSIVTATTLGYGDMFPTTPGGKFVASIWIFMGILVIGLPIGVIGSNFSDAIAEVKAMEERKAKQIQSIRKTLSPRLEDSEEDEGVGEVKAFVAVPVESPAAPSGVVVLSDKELSELTPEEKMQHLMWHTSQLQRLQQSIAADMMTTKK